MSALAFEILLSAEYYVLILCFLYGKNFMLEDYIFFRLHLNKWQLVNSATSEMRNWLKLIGWKTLQYVNQ